MTIFYLGVRMGPSKKGVVDEQKVFLYVSLEPIR